MLEGGLNDIMGSQGGDMFNMLQNGTDLLGESTTTLDGGWYAGDNVTNIDGYSTGTDTDDFDLGDQEALKDAMKEDGNGQGDGPTMLSAANVTIQASNLDIQGLNTGTNPVDNGAQEAIAEGTENAIEEAEIAVDEGDFSLEGGEEKYKRGLFDNLKTFTGLMSGSTDMSSALDSLPEGLKEKIGAENVAKIKAFDNVGGFSEAFKGLNSVMDTMYVDGGAPQDWKNTAQRMDENKKKKDEAAIYNFTNNKQNKEYVSMKLMEEAKGKYKDPDRQQQYVDSNLESRLKSLAQTYAPMGVSNAKLAYEIKDEGKQLGLPPEQAFLNRGNFERFNANQQNTAVVNATYKIDSPTVSQAIPNAREYYNSGYRDVQHMMDAQHIKDTLKTTTDMAMKLENVLRNTGKVNYNGADKAVQAKIDEINKYYEKRLKGGK